MSGSRLLLRLAAALAVVSASTHMAAAFNDAFLGDLGDGAEKLVERCVEEQQCAGLASLNIGPQYFTLKVWDRPVSHDFLVEPAGDALLVDASVLDQLLYDLYLWPDHVPRIGKVNLHELPGLSAEREGLTVTLTPDEAHTPRRDLGGYRTVSPHEFTLPGKAAYAEIAASIDSRISGAHGQATQPRFRVGANAGAQLGLWQLRSRGVVESEQGHFDLGYMYVDRPLLSRAMRARLGYMPADSACAGCVSGSFLGLSLGNDSLGGLLYPSRNTTFVDITVDTDIDEIEIFVNGRSMRRESAFPGTHSVAVTGLTDGPNFIEIYGIDSRSGTRRLLLGTDHTASLGVMQEARTERTIQLGWTVAKTRDLFRNSLDLDGAFLQYRQTTGLGEGREWEAVALVGTNGLLARSGISMPLGRGRAELSAIGTFSEGKAGGGAGLQLSQTFDAISFAARADFCFDCFDGGSMALREGLSGRINGSASTRLGGWSLSGSLGYDLYARDGMDWRVSARRNALGGRLELFAGDTWNFVRDSDWSDDDRSTRHDRGAHFGLRFSRSFGRGERLRTASSEVELVDGRPSLAARYTDRPRSGQGFTGHARADGIEVDGRGDRSLAAGIGYEDDLGQASADVRTGRDGTSVRADVSTGFAWVDGYFVVDRSVSRGGIFVGGLAPDTAVIVDGKEFARTNAMGHLKMHPPRATRPAKIEVDEGFRDGATVTRSASILPLPGAFYGIGDNFRSIERSYRIEIGPEREPILAGTLLRDDSGNIIGAAGDDGIVTVSGRAGAIVFQQPEAICKTSFNGSEPAADLHVLRASCKSVDP
jgi:hypothetical protein